ncbi:hypothetical protein A3A20_00195 [Candidatus Wolfebacteria bacterium RIFCSPLOWO2_01_FULL_45_19]|uniref:Uncharacterized protein n=1 Tax=Candidatus Wolfebacteria bacterium RIFCSPLOWO2_01_FULL_45_19 TaxID=1802557 RepID=A0A1F8DSN7_9BACT|nr:MAG: hypothetical protein UX23_C0007G0023 [Parcubacteria group bacterium GW2011_GWB1_45_9]OGM90989.1 MAG: hypothetical protein A3A20_00195 [Candidatus Wolfebacteria bacterium RIFCSPLOWO2_01_FULL_45_19]
MTLGFRKLLIRRLVIASAALFALGVVLLALLYGINNRVETVIESRDRILLYSSNLENLAVLRSETELASAYREVLATVLPDRSRLFEFMQDVSDFASEHGVDVSLNITGETIGTETSAGNISFNMIARGRSEDIFSFLNSVNDSGYIVNFGLFELISAATTAEARTAGVLFIR